MGVKEDNRNGAEDNGDFLTELDYVDLTPEQKEIRRKHLDERMQLLQNRIRIIEKELRKLESRFYRTCIFGSARIKPDNPIYKSVTKLAELLASEGIDILTGGGPGLMEAANIGAQLGKKKGKTKIRSYGLSIELEWEPLPNPHLDIKRHHYKFSSRLDDFMRLSNSVVVTPGGIGTLLELMFTWQLIQVKHLSKRPVVLLDKEFWSGMIQWLKEQPLSRSLINPDDIDDLELVDTPEEALEIIRRHHALWLESRLTPKDKGKS